MFTINNATACIIILFLTMNSNKTTNVIHFSGMTPYYVINQITICDMKKMLGGDEAKQNPLDSTYTVMLII